MYKLCQPLIQMQEEQRGKEPAMEKRAQNQARLHRSVRSTRGGQVR